MRHYREQLLACDFFNIETIWLKTLTVFFFIDIGTRQVYLAGVTDHLNGHWITQQGLAGANAQKGTVTSGEQHPKTWSTNGANYST